MPATRGKSQNPLYMTLTAKTGGYTCAGALKKNFAENKLMGNLEPQRQQKRDFTLLFFVIVCR